MTSQSNAAAHGTRCVLVAVTISILATAAGCTEKRPRNPALEVVENPPSEITRKYQEVRILLQGQPLNDPQIRVKMGETVRIQVVFPEPHTLPVGANKMVLVRLKPPNASDSNWKEYPFADEFAGPVQQDGTGNFEGIIKAPSGSYDVRCYLLTHNVATEPTPEFHLIGKGILSVVAGTVGP